MKRIEDIKEALSIHLKEIKENFRVRELGILDFQEGKYLEIMVDFEHPVGFFKFFKLEDFLTELLGIQVELTTKDVLKENELKKVIPIWVKMTPKDLPNNFDIKKSIRYKFKEFPRLVSKIPTRSIKKGGTRKMQYIAPKKLGIYTKQILTLFFGK